MVQARDCLDRQGGQESGKRPGAAERERMSRGPPTRESGSERARLPASEIRTGQSKAEEEADEDRRQVWGRRGNEVPPMPHKRSGSCDERDIYFRVGGSRGRDGIRGRARSEGAG